MAVTHSSDRVFRTIIINLIDHIKKKMTVNKYLEAAFFPLEIKNIAYIIDDVICYTCVTFSLH